MTPILRGAADPAGLAATALLGAAGTAAAALAGAPLAVALALGAGTGLLVLAVLVLTTRLTRRGVRRGAPRPESAPGSAPAAGSASAPASARASREPEPPGAFGPETAHWLRRADAAADRLTAYRVTEPLLADAAAYARTAAGQLRRSARAVGVIDASAGGAGPQELARALVRLEQEAAGLPPGALRAAKEASARATAERAAARQRLDELRVVLLATLESTTLRLEAAAERGSLIASFRAADDAALDARLAFAPFDAELAAVQAGLDELARITDDLLGEE